MSLPAPVIPTHDPANKVTAWAGVGQLAIAVVVLIITLVAGEVRLESRITRIETLIEARSAMRDGQIATINNSITNHEERIERLEQAAASERSRTAQ